MSDLIPHHTVTLLSGEGGTGKSLFALQLAVAAATGGRSIGREARPRGRDLPLGQDDIDELHRRLSDIIEREGRDFRDLEKPTLRSLAGECACTALWCSSSHLSLSGLTSRIRNSGSDTDARNAEGTFAPRNPGKPLSSRHRATQTVQAFLESEAEALTCKAVEMALRGDTAARRLCWSGSRHNARSRGSASPCRP